MLRKTLTILSLLGLLFSVGLWGVSYWHVGYLVDKSRNWFVLVSAGALHAGRSTYRLPLTSVRVEWSLQNRARLTFRTNAGEEHDSLWIGGYGSVKRRLLFTSPNPPIYRYRQMHPMMTQWKPRTWFQLQRRGVSVPLWIPSVSFLVLGMSCVVPPAHRRRKRKKLGLCVKCGYDLRASKERCPECGEEFHDGDYGGC